VSLTLYYHPFSSYCWKALLALHENNVPFTARTIDLWNEKDAAELKALWPIGKFPVLQDSSRNHTVPESSIIIEYVDQHYPGKAPLIPFDRELSRQTRMRDRFFDFYVMDPMSKIVTDHFRPAGKNDPHGVELARKVLATAYDMIEKDMAHTTWAMGDIFTMADISASPALFYADLVEPLASRHKNAAAYLDRLMRRPAFIKVLKDALAVLPPGFPYDSQFKASVQRLAA
jgi:glutathione S-transferase